MAYTTIDNPAEHFQPVIWTGNGTDDRAINIDMQPDFVWWKHRTNASYWHYLVDSNRGIGKQIYTNGNDAEGTHAGGHVKSYTATGITIDDDQAINYNNTTYAGYMWKANGGSTSTLTAGSVNSTVQTNSTADFSIITYTGNGVDGANIAHGLSGAWDCVWIKNRGTTDDWQIYHKYQQDNGQNTGGSFNDSGAFATCANTSGRPTRNGTNLINLNDCGDIGSINGNTETYVCYAFKEVKGYSKFGSYIANGNATDGQFVYTGFKPAFILWKNVEEDKNWFVVDSARNPFNPTDHTFYPDTNGAELTWLSFGTAYGLILSNGFKWNSGDSHWNNSGDRYVYMAFAEHPFVSSEGVPCTAK